jgi:cytoskeleton protein RodZ
MRADETAMSAPGDAARAGSSVGTLLRAARQRHGLSVADVAHALRIRAPYIEAIEDGRPADLPAPAYAVGFVKAYAKALGLDEAEILRRFRAEAEGLGRRTSLDFPAPVPERGVPAGAVALLGIMLAAGAYAGWWYFSGNVGRPPETVAPPPERLAGAPPTRAAPPPIPALRVRWQGCR